MDITIFESVTTESALITLETEGKKYDGLYVDMDNAPERKYVKDKAAFISGLLKKIDRVRIDSAKDYKVEVEKQAQAIISRLQDANSPFQVLIDDYAIERKKILDAEKARKQAILDAEQKECDHEMALLINKTYEFDKQQAIQKQLDDDAFRLVERDRFAAQQVVLAEERQKQGIIESLQREKDEENARLANKEHCAKVNNTILACLLNEGFDEHEAKKFIRLAAQNKLPQLTINY